MQYRQNNLLYKTSGSSHHKQLVECQITSECSFRELSTRRMSTERTFDE